MFVIQSDVGQIVDLISKGGLLAVLVIWGWMGYKQIWVWGHHYRREVERGDKWERLALRGTDLAEESVKDVASLVEAVHKVMTRKPEGTKNG